MEPPKCHGKNSFRTTFVSGALVSSQKILSLTLRGLRTTNKPK